MRANRVQLEGRRTVTFDDFRGVDLSSSPLRVSKSRATEMQNFILDNGINRKRNGWREVERFYEGAGVTNVYGKIYGIFDIPADNSILVHAGRGIYRVDKSDLTKTKLSTDIEGIGERPSFAYYYDGVYYIVCGAFLKYCEVADGVYGLKSLNADDGVMSADFVCDAYVPTTTISINHEGDSGSTRETFEPVNMLTGWRRNTLVGAELPENGVLTYRLDGDVDFTRGLEFEIDGVKYRPLDLTANSESVTFGDGTITIYKSGRIEIKKSCAPAVDGDPNIFVTFYHKSAQKIDLGKCTVGATFGTNGLSNRLFIGGHPNYPNADFYSEQDDFTYFPSGNMTTFGTDNVPVVGYARLSDTTQVIYKAENATETTVYYRTGSDENVYDADGNFIKMQTVFKLVAGGIGEGCACSRACANFSGDVLMLSSNGVYGITLSENVATSERYAKERSRSINAELTEKKLSEACAIVYKGRYYLAVDGICYVADARYKYVPEGALDGAFSYEWWRWTNIPAVVFAQIDGELWFGTADGRLCVFDDKYTDRLIAKPEAGEVSLSVGENTVNFNINGELYENTIDGDEVVFSSDVYAVYFPEVGRDGDFYTVDYEKYEALTKRTYNGCKLVAEVDGAACTVYVNKVRRPKEEDESKVFKFKLLTVAEDGTESELSDDGVTRLLILLRDEVRYVVELKGGSFKVAEKIYSVDENGKTQITLETLTLTQCCGAVPTDVSLAVTHIQNVVAKWYTPIMDFGTNVYRKTLEYITVSVDPRSEGVVNFGYETRLKIGDRSVKGITGFSFENIDFYNFSFTTAFASSHTVRIRERAFNYIALKITSEDNYPCAINNVTVTYKVGKRNRGIN